ncbi:MAG TPA: crotonase/enoyl-CoA hydratase family protein [Thermoleophilaceae bacterium]|nr:crotonase/enoyl-CoA hydratase family protein [Thermoleophilaceae bacterium]
MASKSEPVVVERRDNLFIVTMNRPEARNALNGEMSTALAAAFGELEHDSELLVGVLTGAGPGFCAGLDLKEFASNGAEATRAVRTLLQDGCSKPMVAAIEGFAFAGGFELALMCDLLVVARGTRFGLPEVTRSLVANGGGLLRLPRRIPYQAAAEMSLTGDPMTAEWLYGLGLVNRLVEPGDALPRAVELARRIARNRPHAVIGTKKILARHAPSGDEWEQQDAVADPVFFSEEAREGALAFVEKRLPAWERQ